MNQSDLIHGLSRQDWRIIVMGLGKLPGEVMFNTAKNVEAILMAADAHAEQMDSPVSEPPKERVKK